MIYEDLKNYPNSSISEVNKRIGNNISQRVVKSKLDEMITNGLIFKTGGRKGAHSFIYKITMK